MAAVHPSTSCRLSAIVPWHETNGFCYWVYLSMSATKFRYNFLLITQRCSDSVKHLELLQALPVNGCFLNDSKCLIDVGNHIQFADRYRIWLWKTLKSWSFFSRCCLCMLKGRGGGEGIGSALFVLLHALCSVLFVRRHLVNLLPWPRFSAKLLCQRASFKSYSLLESRWLCNKG